MRNQQQIQSVRRQPARCVAIAAQEEQFQQKILRMVLFALAGAIIAMWMAYLPALANSALDTLGIVPQHLSFNAVDRTHKGDRLVRVAGIRFDARWQEVEADLRSLSRPQNPSDARVRIAAAE